MISVFSHLADRLQEVEQTAVVVVGVGEESREHFHHAGIQFLLVGR